MIKKLFFTGLILTSAMGFGQILGFKEKFTLPQEVSETSGLLFFNGKIITHNDSGDTANLYEIDSLSGTLLRTITVANATHIDWEDIAENENYIFIGDFGNNNGNRTDLTIYKIAKADFIANNTVTAELIQFAYSEQEDFSVRTNAHNFDAEAMVVINNTILLFTKNWSNLETDVYAIPTEEGQYEVTKKSNANINGLITGATKRNDKVLLCGYATSAIPFLVFIELEDTNASNIFANGFERYDLSTELGFGSQVEGITSVNSNQFFLSREAVNNPVLNLEQALFSFTDDRFETLSIENYTNTSSTFFPNPVKNNLNIRNYKTCIKVEIFDALGKKVFQSKKIHNTIALHHLKKGVYLINLYYENKKRVQHKFMKL